MLTIILISVITGFLLYNVFKRNPKAPPEAFGLPLVGHIPFLGSNPIITYSKWAKKYGKIIQIRFGFITGMVIDDPEIAKEAFNDLTFAGTMQLDFLKEFNGGKYGILFNDGAMWQEQRRFTMWHLRDFGFGKKAVMESKIMEEVKELIEGFKKEEGKATIVEKRFNVAVLNSLWVIVTGQRYSHDDPQVMLLMDNFKKSVDTIISRMLIILCPRLATIFPGISGWGAFTKAIKDLKDFFNQLVSEHKKDLIEDNPRDFIDSYLDEINRTENPDSSFYKTEGEKSLPAVIFDLFQAGFGTISVTLNWAVLYLSTNLDVQRKFQAEIDTVIGKSRLPSMDDKANMPYTEALLMEVLRKSSLVGVVPPHRVMADTTFHGYEIKKGSMVTANTYSIHHNPEIWGDPENFRPERFLDAQGNCVKRHDALLPFSVGKRACIGESLARDEIFLFLVTIYQRFNIKPDPNTPKPSLVPRWTGVMAPPEYKVIMEDRF